MKKSYKTKNKQHIMQYIDGQGNKHFSANDMLMHFSKENISVSLPTIYRWLERFCHEGYIAKYRTAARDTAFYYKTDISQTPLMMCTDCGKSVALKCHEAEALAGHIVSEHKFFIKVEKTVFYGKCQGCASH